MHVRKTLNGFSTKLSPLRDCGVYLLSTKMSLLSELCCLYCFSTELSPLGDCGVYLLSTKISLLSELCGLYCILPNYLPYGAMLFVLPFLPKYRSYRSCVVCIAFYQTIAPTGYAIISLREALVR